MIDSFKGDYRFLSNFWPATIIYEGEIYPTSEHAFQATKCFCIDHAKEVLACSTPGKAKRLARTFPMRPDWEEVKRQIMYDIVKDKFTRSKSLGGLLLETGHEVLVEGNTWRDTYWGICKGIGKNHLGRILMRVRRELRQQETD